MDNDFKNPMFSGADPFVLFYEGKYYLYCTTENDSVLVGANDFSTNTPDKTLLCAYHCHNIYSDYFKPRMACLNTAEFVKDENGSDRLVINGPYTVE